MGGGHFPNDMQMWFNVPSEVPSRELILLVAAQIVLIHR